MSKTKIVKHHISPAKSRQQLVAGTCRWVASVRKDCSQTFTYIVIITIQRVNCFSCHINPSIITILEQVISYLCRINHSHYHSKLKRVDRSPYTHI